MTENWPSAAVELLSHNIPRDLERPGWNDFALSAYQMGCEALVALGYAEPTACGARPLSEPRLSDPLPRWDDVCCSVLGLAAQNGLLRYVGPNTHARSTTSPGANPYVPIAPAHGLGSAVVTPEVASVLEVLNLVSRGYWSAAAELVLWRDQPREWQMDIASDPRFVAAVDVAAATMPETIRRSFDRLTTITDSEIADCLDRERIRQSDQTCRGLTLHVASLPRTSAEAKERIAFARTGELDWLFFRQWRLGQGWLNPDDAACAIAIFHDPLAMAVRHGVVALGALGAQEFSK